MSPLVVNILIGVALVLIVGGAVFYIYKAKKSGRKCIGCPSSKSCSQGCPCCNCHSDEKDKEETPKDEEK